MTEKIGDDEFDLEPSHYKLGVVPDIVRINHLRREIELIKERLDALEAESRSLDIKRTNCG